MRYLILFLVVGFSFLSGKVDINHASAKELESLKGIGQKVAMRIVEFRESSCFSSTDELKKVKGIGVGRFEKIKGMIEVKPCEIKK